jgi:hypothetical protein
MRRPKGRARATKDMSGVFDPEASGRTLRAFSECMRMAALIAEAGAAAVDPGNVGRDEIVAFRKYFGVFSKARTDEDRCAFFLANLCEHWSPYGAALCQSMLENSAWRPDSDAAAVLRLMGNPPPLRFGAGSDNEAALTLKGARLNLAWFLERAAVLRGFRVDPVTGMELEDGLAGHYLECLCDLSAKQPNAKRRHGDALRVAASIMLQPRGVGEGEKSSATTAATASGTASTGADATSAPFNVSAPSPGSTFVLSDVLPIHLMKDAMVSLLRMMPNHSAAVEEKVFRMITPVLESMQLPAPRADGTPEAAVRETVNDALGMLSRMDLSFDPSVTSDPFRTGAPDRTIKGTPDPSPSASIAGSEKDSENRSRTD